LLAVEIDPSLRHELTTIRVRLTQGDRDESVEFVPKPTNKYRVYIERGVFLDDGAYRLDLGSPGSRGALDADWDADERAHVVVEGLSYSGKKIFRHDERFKFDAHYPNGRACDKDDPGLSHLIRVAERDLL